MLSRYYLLASIFICSSISAFNMGDLKKYKIDEKAQWMLSHLQSYAWKSYNVWGLKRVALATGLVTSTQWDNIPNFKSLIDIPGDILQTYLLSCTDALVDAMYQFAAQAKDNDDLVRKQNERILDKSQLPNLDRNLALQRIVETAIFDCAVKPTRKA